MIFVTVGAQMPFDRLVRTVDAWAGSRKRSDVYAQIGTTEFRPRYIDYIQFLAPDDLRGCVQGADVVVAHAGMGSILTALEFGKPILVLPRRGDLRETRNDHQIHCAQRLLGRCRVEVARDERELEHKLDQMQYFAVSVPLSRVAPASMIQPIKEFILNGGVKRHGSGCRGKIGNRSRGQGRD